MSTDSTAPWLAGLSFPCRPEAGRALAARLAGKRPTFVCVIAHTDTCLTPGISAAGATTELRVLTPAADAEALFYGRARCLAGVPSNPHGPPGPAIITIAALRLLRARPLVVDAGTRALPAAPTIRLGAEPGRHIVTGQAVPGAAALFERGRALGRRLGQVADYLVIGESVPGGTTTALAVLLALGVDAEGRVSSSLGDNAHQLKSRIARRALAVAGLSAPGQASPGVERRASVLDILSRVGDPMQPVVAGMVLGALAHCPVLLAGGTQMVAVLAASAAAAAELGEALPDGLIAVATTRWVVDDPTSDFAGLLAEVAPVPGIAARLSFARSRHPLLRLYERFLVKEGVGAGGAAVAAMLAGAAGPEELFRETERVYENLVTSAARET